jgi:Carboxypeptidase regulatory-like domain/TonB dependent receptor
MIGKWIRLFPLLGVLLAGALGAQTTASLRGTVKGEDGGVLAGASLVAIDAASGFTYAATTNEAGSYNLTLPPADYRIEVLAAGFENQIERLRIQVGQSANLDVQMTKTLSVSEEISVVAEPVVELRTSEVATNVTQEQIENLPQNSRNFLNFAALAPGVRLSNDEFRKEVTAGALPSRNTNVFIDGASYKNNVLEGGVVGQDASRGNPFPQVAVQEFRVLTQNFKAEYQQASSAVITAITKSGTNKFLGDVFVLYQDKSLVEEDVFAEERGEPKPEYERFQSGLSLGGPIVQDKSHFFFAYEGNRQDRFNRVRTGSSETPPVLEQYVGSFKSPFRSTLLFGKVSYQPAQSHLLDVSFNSRHETDIRNFGDLISYDSAENVKNDVNTLVARYQWVAGDWLSETTFNAQRSQWNPTPINEDEVGVEFTGLIRIGRDTTQDFTQDRLSLRQDLSRLGFEWHGDHGIKAGFNYDHLKYDVEKRLFGNPLFIFRFNESLTIPVEARYGTGNPDLSADNNQFGLYFQDDWALTGRLTANLGIRYDYETDQLNNDYVTPPQIRTDLGSLVDGDSYFTDGNDRKPFKGAIQPRVGFSYDLLGNGKTVAFAGYGRYYDRSLYNDGLDERFRLQYGVRLFRFSVDGAPRDGFPTIVWRPEYASRNGLDGLIAQGIAPNPEVFLIANDTKPPVSDELSLGLRQVLGRHRFAVTYTSVKSKNGFTYLFGTRRPDGTCCIPPANYSNVLISSDARQAWYDAIYFTVDRPYTSSSRWGYSLAYTYGNARQNGGDLFSLDFPTVADYPVYPTNNDEQHRVVFSGIVGLPWDVKLSTLINLGSGLPYNIADASLGFGPNEFRFRRNEGRPEKESFIIPNAWAFRTVDLRLQKDFPIGAHSVGVVAEVFNAFNYENYGDFNGFIAPTSGPPNQDFGKPNKLIEPGRRFQLGLNFAL